MLFFNKKNEDGKDDGVHRFETEFGGKQLIVEVGKLALQANASCTVQYGDTVVLATATMGKEPRDGIDYFPLMVDYEEKFYAAGKIKGSRYIKREGRPSDEAVLNGRMIDRALRPLFDKTIKNDVQIIITVLSTDGENDPDVVSLIAASIAVHISDIPWAGPVAGIRIGQIDGEWLINGSHEARGKSILDLVVGTTMDKVIMVDAESREAGEDMVYQAFEFAVKHTKKLISFIDEIRDAVGKEKQSLTIMSEEDELTEDEKLSEESFQQLVEESKEFLRSQLDSYVFNIPKGSKRERKEMMGKLQDVLEAHLIEKQVGKEKRNKLIKNTFFSFIEEEISRAILEKNIRVDGRGADDIRHLDGEVGLLKRTHGSGLFTRGETQVLSIVTLGAPGDEQTFEGMEESGKKNFMHHYNFPPFSVGEAGPMRGPGRRDIGHGSIAERAIKNLLPEKEKFPYTIRVVSEVLSSNGSSSMAATCGSTLALMDAGVPLEKPVAGIAMGLASDDQGRFKVITDLQDLEDGDGGMDFKIAGTRDGITCIQMDTKTHGLTLDIVKETLSKSKDARHKILDVIEETIKEPRQELSSYAPRILTMQINPDKIRDVIGPGGKIINEIIDATGVSIDIEQDGMVFITSESAEGMDRAQKWIEDLTKEAKIGDIYEGKVSRLFEFGAMVEIFANQEGLVHISEIAPYRVNKVTDKLKVGQVVKVKVVSIDEQGRVNLSIKALLPKEDNQEHAQPRSHK
ncbi:MAG TPA: polyribonucleotide nucleotidyltransferase [Candidatus Bipolaricaulota bacterium]|nr:polyribonucleotide nucleotidyltransferase [Candidatus Bipolaricaulota bacterium]